MQGSQRDMANLETSFSAFNKMTNHLAKSIDHGQVDASQASASLLAVKDEVQASVREWARGVSDKSTRMVEDLLEHQQEHLSMVRHLILASLIIRSALYWSRLQIWSVRSYAQRENTLRLRLSQQLRQDS